MGNPFTAKTAPPMMAGDWQTEDRQLEYQRRLAEKMAEDDQMPQGGMVGGVYVSPAWTQMLAKALNPMLAQRKIDDIDKRQRGLTESRTAERMGTLDRFSKAMTGTPESMTGQMYPAGNNPDEEGGMGYQPAVAGDRNAAMAELGKSRDPALQNLYMAQMLKGMEPKKPIVVGRTLMDETGKQIGVDSTWQSEQQAAREAKAAELQMRLEDQRISREERASLSRELANMNIAARRDMADATRAAGREKAPSGYRFAADGSLVAISGGPADPKMKTGADGMPKLTESQGKANLYQSRATESDKIISDLEGKYSPLAINAKQGVGKVWGVGGALEAGVNVALPENAQKAEQAQRDFVNAILRLESGAVISEPEFANAQKQYFPQPGDAQEVIDQKKANRATAIAGLKVMAGPAATMKPQQPAGGGFKVLGVEE